MIYRFLASTPRAQVQVSGLSLTPLVGRRVGLLGSTPRRSGWMRRALSLTAAIGVVCGLSVAASGQTSLPPAPATNWTQQAPANAPSARGGQAMAYDSAHGQVVLFGGDSSSDTWLWNGTNWRQPNPVSSPPARSAAAMAYDAATGANGDVRRVDSQQQQHPAGRHVALGRHELDAGSGPGERSGCTRRPDDGAHAVRVDHELCPLAPIRLTEYVPVKSSAPAGPANTMVDAAATTAAVTIRRTVMVAPS